MSSYTKLPIQFATKLVIFREREALWEQARTSNASTDDRRKLIQSNGYDTSDTVEALAVSDANEELDAEVVMAADMALSWKTNHIEDRQLGFAAVLIDFLDPPESDLDAGMIEYEYQDINGAITIVRRRGLLGALYHDMAANAQYVTANGVTIGSITAANGNLGVLEKTSATGESHALTGTVIVECIDASVTKPQFRVTLKLADYLIDGTLEIEGDRNLTAEKSWQDGQTGLTMTLTRTGLATPTESGDGGNIFSSTSFTTPKSGDCDNGVFYFSVTRQSAAPIWLIECFNLSSRVSTSKVGFATADGTSGTTALSITMSNGTVFATTFSKTNANTALASAGNADTDIQWDIDQPQVGDRWTMTCTNDEAGKYSTKLARIYRASLPIAGSTLWTDSNANSQSIS